MVGNAAGGLIEWVIRQKKWVVYAVFLPEANPVSMVFNDLFEERRFFRDFRRLVGVETDNHDARFFGILALMRKSLLPK